MKAPLFFIAAIAAFLTLPVDFTVAASVLFGAGLAAILIGDYGRKARFARALVGVGKSRERFRLAA